MATFQRPDDLRMTGHCFHNLANSATGSGTDATDMACHEAHRLWSHRRIVTGSTELVASGARLPDHGQPPLALSIATVAIYGCHNLRERLRLLPQLRHAEQS